MEVSVQRLSHLAAGELLRIDAVAQACVVVFHGKVWITQEGDLADYVIEGGGSFTCDRAGLALVEALVPTTLAVFSYRAETPAASFAASAETAADPVS